MQGGERKPMLCKFGDNCFKLQKGQCTYYHPPNQMQGMQGGMGGGKQGGMGGMGGNYMQNKPWNGN